jgi:starch synthase
VFIGRLAKQKGIDLFMEKLNEIGELPANFAILGTGDSYYNEFFNSIKGRYENIFVEVAFDEPLSRKMYASADFLLMPSLYEPCGLNQMIAMRYGTLVVARKTGGLADTVRDLSEPGGYGFLFEEFNSDEFLSSVKRAVEFYRSNRERLLRLKQFVMGIDFSWNSSALKYFRLYENLIEGRIR